MRALNVSTTVHTAKLRWLSNESNQLPYLFLANLSILTVGIGLLPILPLFAGQLGASPTLVGFSLAMIYIAISFGSWLTSLLVGKMPARTLMVAAGALGAPAVIGLGQAASLWQMVLLASIVWFTGGIGLGLISVLASQQAGENERGKWFSWIALTNPVGSILGGLLVGRLVESHGYAGMFLVIGLVYTAWPLIGLLKLKQAAASAVQPKKAPSPVQQANTSFQLLLLAALFSAITVSVNRLGLSLSMESHHFSATAIADANVIAGLAVVPLVLWLGPLSDRIGRKGFLLAGYLAAASGAAMLVIASDLWQFWVITTVTMIARTIGGALAGALATDVLPKASLGRGLPRLNMMNWIAAIAGSAGSGLLLDAGGPTILYLAATALSIGAAGLVGVLPVRRGEH